MKKFITKVFALICIISLFTAPTSVLAASVAVCTYNANGLKLFTLQPSPLQLEPGNAFVCADTTTSTYGYFTVPANTNSTFRCKFSSSCQYTLTVIRTGASYINTINGTTSEVYVSFPESDMERQYIVLINAISDCTLIDYYFHLY